MPPTARAAATLFRFAVALPLLAARRVMPPTARAAPTLFRFAVALPLLAAACDRHAVETWLSEAESRRPATPSLYTDEGFATAWAEIERRVPSPVRALSLLVYSDHLVLQVQNPAAPSTALQYVYRDGAVQKPVPVKLLGTGKLEDNLFPLDAARVEAIPALVRAARARVTMPDGDVARVLLKRNLPESTDVEFRVHVTSQRRDAWVSADQNGKIRE